MSHAPSIVTQALLDGGADADIAVDVVTSYWAADDDACDVLLPDGSTIISARVDPQTANRVRAEVQANLADGESTPVRAVHLDALGLREAVAEWAAE